MVEKNFSFPFYLLLKGNQQISGLLLMKMYKVKNRFTLVDTLISMIYFEHFALYDKLACHKLVISSTDIIHDIYMIKSLLRARQQVLGIRTRPNPDLFASKNFPDPIPDKMLSNYQKIFPL
jgi:hypothetical protein